MKVLEEMSTNLRIVCRVVACFAAIIAMLGCGRPNGSTKEKDSLAVPEDLNSGFQPPYGSRSPKLSRNDDTGVVYGVLAEIDEIDRMLDSTNNSVRAEGLERSSALRKAVDDILPVLTPFASQFADRLRDATNAADAAYILMKLNSDYSELILAAVTNRNEETRTAAAMTIANYPDHSVFVERAPELLKMNLDDEHRLVRWSAARALGALHSEPDSVIPALKAVLTSDPDRIVKLTALGALAKFGTNAHPYLAQLQRIAEDEDDNAVREKILELVEQFEEDRASSTGY